jgi:hypothetical protein
MLQIARIVFSADFMPAAASLFEGLLSHRILSLGVFFSPLYLQVLFVDLLRSQTDTLGILGKYLPALVAMFKLRLCCYLPSEISHLDSSATTNPVFYPYATILWIDPITTEGEETS